MVHTWYPQERLAKRYKMVHTWYPQERLAKRYKMVHTWYPQERLAKRYKMVHTWYPQERLAKRYKMVHSWYPQERLAKRYKMVHSWYPQERLAKRYKMVHSWYPQQIHMLLQKSCRRWAAVITYLQFYEAAQTERREERPKENSLKMSRIIASHVIKPRREHDRTAADCSKEQCFAKRAFNYGKNGGHWTTRMLKTANLLVPWAWSKHCAVIFSTWSAMLYSLYACLCLCVHVPENSDWGECRIFQKSIDRLQGTALPVPEFQYNKTHGNLKVKEQETFHATEGRVHSWINDKFKTTEVGCMASLVANKCRCSQLFN